MDFTGLYWIRINLNFILNKVNGLDWVLLDFEDNTDRI